MSRFTRNAVRRKRNYQIKIRSYLISQRWGHRWRHLLKTARLSRKTCKSLIASAKPCYYPTIPILRFNFERWSRKNVGHSNLCGPFDRDAIRFWRWNPITVAAELWYDYILENYGTDFIFNFLTSIRFYNIKLK